VPPRPYPGRALAWFAPVAALLAFLAVPRPVDPLFVVAGFAAYIVAAAAGLFFATRIAGDTPNGVAWPERIPLTPRLIITSIAWGLLLGGVALITIFTASRRAPAVLARLRPRMSMPVWKRLILATHAGISEEIVFRLFLLSAIVWAALLILRRLGPRVSASRIFWTSNIVIALLFGVAHLPAWAATTTVTVPLAAAVISVNGFVSLVLGHVYWRYGIVAAALAHICADATLWGLGPWLLALSDLV
jgi:membrane protease YdiL (CAAX protease family)